MEQLLNRLWSYHSTTPNRDKYFCVGKTWSPVLFMEDLVNFPVLSDDTLAEELCKKEKGTYLEFFSATRGYERKIKDTDFSRSVWDVFSSGSLMLYFESTFLRLMNQEPNREDKVLLKYMKVMSKKYVCDWISVVSQIGAHSVQSFIADPTLYSSLPYRKNKGRDDFNQQTDKEILDRLGYKIGFTADPKNKILSSSTTRKDILELAKQNENL